VLPGGSVTVTCVCDRSSGGMKPVGSSGTSMNEPTKNTSAPSSVHQRWRRHQAAQRPYIFSQLASRSSFFGGFIR
jgi:hypothetical protein